MKKRIIYGAFIFVVLLFAYRVYFPNEELEKAERGKVAADSPKNVAEMIRKSEFGDAWPFSVDSGMVACIESTYVVFIVGQKTYALNGVAQTKYKSVDEIWLDDVKMNKLSTVKVKKSIGAILQKGLENCK